MRKFKLAIMLILLAPLATLAQIHRDLANFNYGYIPVKLGDTSASARTIDFDIAMPVFNRPKESLTLKLDLHKITFNEFPEDTQGTLYGTAIQGAYTRKLGNGNKALTLFGQLGIFSDFDDISGEDFRGTIGFQYKYTRSEKLRYGLGLAYSNQFFGHQISPYITFDYRPSKKWDIYGQFPTNFRAAYLFSDKDILAFGVRGSTNSYRLSKELKSHPYDNSGFIQTTQWSSRLYYEHYFGKHISINGSAGFAFVNKFRQYDDIPGSMLDSWTIITVPVGKKRPDPVREISKPGMVYQIGISYNLF